MWFLIPVAAVGLGLAFLYDSINESEKKASIEWKNKRQEVEKTLAEHESNIKEYLRRAKSNLQYRELVDYHYSSFKVADQAYALMKNSEVMLKGVEKLIRNTNKYRSNLSREIDEVKRQRNKPLFDEKVKEFKNIEALRKQQIQDKENLLNEVEGFKKKLNELNIQTSRIKEKIRTECGQKGRDWYARLEARKRNK